MKRLLLFFCLATFSTVTSVRAQDDVMEKIKQLELQIQELKHLKEQQSVSDKKTEDCMKAVSRDAFCSCVGVNLPRDVSFEQYVHTIVSSKDDLGYSGLSSDHKQSIDKTIAVREQCIEKGFFK